MKDNTDALTNYLIGLALLEANGKTFVNREIREVISKIEEELDIKK